MNNDPIFRSTLKNNRSLEVRSLRRRIDFYLKQAGLKKAQLSAHSLRRTSASLAIEAGCGLLELQVHLNHKSPDTTVRYIARLDKIKNKVAHQIPIKI